MARWLVFILLVFFAPAIVLFGRFDHQRLELYALLVVSGMWTGSIAMDVGALYERRKRAKFDSAFFRRIAEDLEEVGYRRGSDTFYHLAQAAKDRSAYYEDILGNGIEG